MRKVLLAVALALSAQSAEIPLMNYVPADAGMIAGIHVDRSLGSPFGQFLLTQMKEDDVEFRRFVETTGFDPRRDLRELLIVSRDGGRDTSLILARGVFNGPQIMSAAQNTGAAITTYKGVQVAYGRSTPGWVAIVAGSLAVAGEESLVKAVLDNRDTAIGSTSALLRRAVILDGKHHAWIVASRLPGIPGLQQPRSPGTRRPSTPGLENLQGIEEFGAGADFGADIRITGEVLARSEKDAQALVDVVKFLSGFLQLSQDGNPQALQLQKLLNQLQMSAVGRNVNFSLSLPQSDFEALLSTKRKVNRAPRQSQ